MSEERVSFIPPGGFVGPLKDTMTISGFYDADQTGPFYAAMAGQPVRLTVMAPRSRWQAFKAIHEEAWWMRWLVVRWPVRTKATHHFAGHIKSVDDVDDDGPSITMTTTADRDAA